MPKFVKEKLNHPGMFFGYVNYPFSFTKNQTFFMTFLTITQVPLLKTIETEFPFVPMVIDVRGVPVELKVDDVICITVGDSDCVSPYLSKGQHRVSGHTCTESY